MLPLPTGVTPPTPRFIEILVALLEVHDRVNDPELIEFDRVQVGLGGTVVVVVHVFVHVF